MIDASRYVGIRYKRRCCGWGGVDCWGLVRLFYREELGMELPVYGVDFRRVADVRGLIGGLAEDETEYYRCEDPVCVVVMDTGMVGDGVGDHVGVRVSRDWMLQATGRMYSRLSRMVEYKDRIVGCWRYREQR